MTTAEQIAAILQETGETEARAAVRCKARTVVEQYLSLFGEPTMPLDMEMLASLRDIQRSEEQPTHSHDAELVPESDGRVSMRVNPDRPETRQRFSMAHEIIHTLFPEYQAKVRCRTDSRYRDPANPEDLLEILCDVGAAELLFPLPWFASDALAVRTASGLIALADTYTASREATLRRFAEIATRPLAAVFFTWKLKPTQERTIGRKDQMNIFKTEPEAEARSAWKLRIDYAIPSTSFSTAGHFLPKDKSIKADGPFGEAARGTGADGECRLDLGGLRGLCRVLAVPLYTPQEERGPGGELAVAAIIEPLDLKQPKKSTAPAGPSLFD